MYLYKAKASCTFLSKEINRDTVQETIYRGKPGSCKGKVAT